MHFLIKNKKQKMKIQLLINQNTFTVNYKYFCFLL